MAVENEKETKDVKESAEGAAAAAASGAAAEMSAEVFSRSASGNPQDAKISGNEKGQSLQDYLDKGGSLKELVDNVQNGGGLKDLKDLGQKGSSLDDLKDLGAKGEALKDLLDLSKKSEKLADFLPPGDKIPPLSDIIRSPWQQLTIKTDGSHDLKTGDRLVIKDGKETLVTPNGDIITVNKDGSVKVEGEVKEVSIDKDGNQVYTMADGAKVTIGKDGIRSVERDHQKAHLLAPLRAHPVGIGPIGPHGPFGPFAPGKDAEKYPPGLRVDSRRGS